MLRRTCFSILPLLMILPSLMTAEKDKKDKREFLHIRYNELDKKIVKGAVYYIIHNTNFDREKTDQIICKRYSKHASYEILASDCPGLYCHRRYASDTVVTFLGGNGCYKKTICFKDQCSLPFLDLRRKIESLLDKSAKPYVYKCALLKANMLAFYNVWNNEIGRHGFSNKKLLPEKSTVEIDFYNKSCEPSKFAKKVFTKQELDEFQKKYDLRSFCEVKNESSWSSLCAIL